MWKNLYICGTGGHDRHFVWKKTYFAGSVVISTSYSLFGAQALRWFGSFGGGFAFARRIEKSMMSWEGSFAMSSVASLTCIVVQCVMRIRCTANCSQRHVPTGCLTCPIGFVDSFSRTSSFRLNRFRSVCLAGLSRYHVHGI